MYVCPLTIENRKGNIINVILRPDIGARDCHKIVKTRIGRKNLNIAFLSLTTFSLSLAIKLNRQNGRGAGVHKMRNTKSQENKIN